MERYGGHVEACWLLSAHLGLLICIHEPQLMTSSPARSLYIGSMNLSSLLYIGKKLLLMARIPCETIIMPHERPEGSTIITLVLPTTHVYFFPI